ncbi:putative sulfate exporter family transporter [Cereibacter sphaeroides]|nr:putative sulfate exporter family transporter [Cereibacter sphaeroides]
MGADPRGPAGGTLTTLAGGAIGRLLSLPTEFGTFRGRAAVCGASAALPQDKTSSRNTVFVVIAVTTLSTVAMVACPLPVRRLGMDKKQAGIFLGATIHDVAQVAGAASMLSKETGRMATLTKLLRMAFLAPVVRTISMLLFRGARSDAALARAPLPGFLVAFVLIVVSNSLGLLPMGTQSPWPRSDAAAGWWGSRGWACRPRSRSSRRSVEAGGERGARDAVPRSSGSGDPGPVRMSRRQLHSGARNGSCRYCQ